MGSKAEIYSVIWAAQTVKLIFSTVQNLRLKGLQLLRASWLKVLKIGIRIIEN